MVLDSAIHTLMKGGVVCFNCLLFIWFSSNLNWYSFMIKDLAVSVLLYTSLILQQVHGHLTSALACYFFDYVLL